MESEDRMCIRNLNAMRPKDCVTGYGYTNSNGSDELLLAIIV